jgi:molybdopterin synthase catalytic subunit
MADMIRVQEEDFDIGAEIAGVKSGRTDIGAIVTFTGTMRDTSGGKTIDAMTLEHYPGMTEAELARIESESHARWKLQASLIIHRYGRLEPGDNIVLVITASEHREVAFRAAEFLMDYLKSHAPFWKCECSNEGDRWVEAEAGDVDALLRWDDDKDATE